MILAWEVVKAWQIHHSPYDITLLVTSLSMLAYLLQIKIAILTQGNSLSAIFPYVHFCLTSGQEHWHSNICWHSSIHLPSNFNCHY